MGAETSRVALPETFITWYRPKLDPETSLKLHQTSDGKAFLQTIGFLSLLLGSAFAAFVCNSRGEYTWTVLFVLWYGLQANFLINAMHELGHGFVFKTKWWNGFFLRVVSFLGWLHPDMFFSSHIRHHKFTQNHPLDQENPMPIRITLLDFFSFGFINIVGFFSALKQTFRAAVGLYPTGHLGWLPEWEAICYPDGNNYARLPAMRWAQFLLVGHAVIDSVAVYNGSYLLPFLLSFGPFFNGWLFFLCNSTQHIGLLPNVNDFRLNTRTFIVNPFIRFLYWHMNWHCEHHMFSAVPCYNLAELHELIKHELPVSPDGLIAVWKDIIYNARKDKNKFT